ncbi:putative HTH-type transcriptional regulator [Candidatus Lokiarchaeum ossiferum]|uniref:HTH-type transcriptional regulator n=1 Tax=Candidatus Lokiarchaeum ossiferum TaxID=2951803 RepID=A0ABY6HP26_9ARCH|nr:putative HTH-type transcriptional regulator [Candidatus Lokiarchaeum sp. B-35]
MISNYNSGGNMEHEEKPHIDLIDRNIISILKNDARTSYRQIADEIGKTEATVRRRVNRMIRDQIIRKFTIVLDEKRLDNPTKATIKIQPDLNKIKSITEELLKIDAITDIWRLSGDCGVFVRVELPSLEHLDPLIEDQISKISGVSIKETCFVTKEVKTKY